MNKLATTNIEKKKETSLTCHMFNQLCRKVNGGIRYQIQRHIPYTLRKIIFKKMILSKTVCFLCRGAFK